MAKLVGSLLLPLCALAVVQVVQETHVQACSAPLPGVVSTRRLIPADGTTNVPTNTRILLSYEGTSGEIPDHPKLRGPDGVDVPSTLSVPVGASGIPARATYVLVPSTSLEANAKYTVLSDYAQLPCVQNNLAIVGAGGNPMCFPTTDGGASFGGDAGVPPTNIIGSFTTGAGPDTTPPVLSGSLSYTVGDHYTCDSGACCGPYDAFTVGFAWDHSGNAGDTVVYELSDDAGVVFMPTPDTTTVGDVTPLNGTLYGVFLCSGTIISAPAMVNGSRFIAKAGTYTVVAVDGAGNRSQPIRVSVAVDCSMRTDAGADGGIGDGPSDATLVADVRDKADQVTAAAGEVGVTLDLAVAPDTIDASTADRVDDAGRDQAANDVVLAGASEAGQPWANGGSSGAGGAVVGTSGAGGSARPGAGHDGGCSCRLGKPAKGSPALTLTALASLLVLRRRRRP